MEPWNRCGTPPRRLAGAARPELPPHGRARDRAHRGGRGRARPQPPLAGRGRRRRAAARAARRRRRAGLGRRPGAAGGGARARRVPRPGRRGGAALRRARLPVARGAGGDRAGHDPPPRLRRLRRLGRRAARGRARGRGLDPRARARRRRVHRRRRRSCGATSCAARAGSTSSSPACPRIRASTEAAAEREHVRQARQRERARRSEQASSRTSASTLAPARRPPSSGTCSSSRGTPTSASGLDSRMLSTTVRPTSRTTAAPGSSSSRYGSWPGVADERAELALQRVALVPPVPEQGEPAAGPEHAVQLRQRPLAVEPVERLAGERRVDARVGERDRLGRPLVRLGRRHRLPQLLEHRGSRLDRDDVEAERDEAARQLPRSRRRGRARARPGSSPSCVGGPAQRLLRVLGPVPLVLRGDGLEAAGERASDTARRAEVVTTQSSQRGRARVADAAAVPDQQVREAGPVGARHEPDEVALDLDRILLPRQPEPLREAADVRVDDDPLRLAELGRDDVRRLARDARQADAAPRAFAAPRRRTPRAASASCRAAPSPSAGRSRSRRCRARAPPAARRGSPRAGGTSRTASA